MQDPSTTSHAPSFRRWKDGQTTVRRVVPCVVEIGGGDGRPAHREELRDLQRGLERLRVPRSVGGTRTGGRVGVRRMWVVPFFCLGRGARWRIEAS